MRDILKSLRADEGAAVTVDWVVLTAACLGLALLVLGSVRDGAQDVAGAPTEAGVTGAPEVPAAD